MKRIKFYITHFVDSFAFFVKHVDYIVGCIGAAYNYYAWFISNDIARAVTTAICAMQAIFLSKDVSNDALRTGYELHGQMADYLYVDSNFSAEYHYTTALEHMDYEFESMKAKYVGNQILGNYNTFAIGQDGIALYDWMFFDI